MPGCHSLRCFQLFLQVKRRLHPMFQEFPGIRVGIHVLSKGVQWSLIVRKERTVGVVTVASSRLRVPGFQFLGRRSRRRGRVCKTTCTAVEVNNGIWLNNGVRQIVNGVTLTVLVLSGRLDLFGILVKHGA